MTKRRLYDLLTILPVDKRTLVGAAQKMGVRIVYIGRSGPLVSEADYERIERDGVPYHKDTMTKKGLR